MVISKNPQRPSRPRIAFLGNDGSFASGKIVFALRGYELVKADEGQLLDKHFVGSIDSTILIPPEEKHQFVPRLLDTYGKLLLDSDCRIYVWLLPSAKYDVSSLIRD